MDEAPEHESSSGYLRLPWQLVAGALLLVLAVALGAGLIANRNLRERLTVPTATAVPLAVVTSTLAVPAMVAPTATAVIAASSTPIVTAQATTEAATPAAAAGASASPVPVPSARPTVDPGLAEQVTEAYQRYWQVRAEALFALDTSHLSEVAAGEHLDQLVAFVDDLRSKGQVGETDVEHHFVVLEASGSRAVIGDSYVSNSVVVDATTHTRLTEPTGDNLQEFFTLTRLDGSWKVADVVRSR
jgi:hypothetical protein